MAAGDAYDRSELEGRVSSTETAIKGLAENQRALEATVDKGFRQVFEAIERVTDRQSTQRSGTFGALTTIAGIAVTVVLAIGAAIGSGYVRDIERMHYGMDKLDERLQMEMRLIDSATNAKLLSAEERAADDRGRIRDRVAVLEEEVKDTRETSARLQERVGIHVSRDVAKH